MIPVWVWDNRAGTYVALPAPVQQFSTGKWGWTREQYCSNQKIEVFALTHSHLLDFINERTEEFAWMLPWERIELKLKKPPSKVKWYSRATARITKVQR